MLGHWGNILLEAFFCIHLMRSVARTLDCLGEKPWLRQVGVTGQTTWIQVPLELALALELALTSVLCDLG